MKVELADLDTVSLTLSPEEAKMVKAKMPEWSARNPRLNADSTFLSMLAPHLNGVLKGYSGDTYPMDFAFTMQNLRDLKLKDMQAALKFIEDLAKQCLKQLKSA